MIGGGHMSQSPQLLLATSRALEDGEPGHDVLDAALAMRGIRSAWAAWDDPLIDWGEAKMVAVRTVGDYDTRIADFLGWAHGLGSGVLHGDEVFRWNTDKSYLVDLASMTKIPTVPTIVCKNPVELRKAIGTFGTSVVKPRVGTGGRGIVLVYDSESWLPVDQGPWVVQPLLKSVHHEGEVSVFVIDGRAVSQMRRVASGADIRATEQYGGTAQAAELSEEAAFLAVDAVAATTEILGRELVYARIDMLRSDGKLLVSGIEITDPSLYLDVLPENAEKFADALAARL